MRKDGIAFLNGKLFKAVRGGVKITDLRDGTKRFIANSWYTGDKLAEIMEINLIKYNENPFNSFGRHSANVIGGPGIGSEL